MVAYKRSTEVDRRNAPVPNARVIDEAELRQPVGGFVHIPVAPASPDSEMIGLRPNPRRAATRSTRIDRSVMPEITRRDRQASSDKRRDDQQTQARINSSTKISLVLYMIVVAILAVAVLATGVAINSSMSRIVSLESQVASRHEMLISQNSELDLLSDNIILQGQAAALGMVPVDTVTQLAATELTEVKTYTPSTNWFDMLCCFLSSIFAS